MRYVICLILIFSTISASAQIFVPLSFWRPKTGALVISDGATYDYGTIAAGTPADKVFTLTNTTYVAVNTVAGAAFTGSNPSTYSFKDGTFPGTGGDCGTSLVGFGACTFVVTANHGTAVTRTATINITYNDGVAAQTAQRPVTATFTTTPTRLVWVSPPSFIKFNSCTQLTVQAQDNSGTPINVSPAVTVNLAINNTANPVYYTSNTCATSTTSITIANGTNSQNVWIRTTVANESGIIVASATGLTGATQNIYFTDNPSRLLMYAVPQAKVNFCYEIKIYTADAIGLTSAVSSNLTVTLNTTGSNVFYSNASCTTPLVSNETIVSTGQAVATIYTMNLVSETVTATASATSYSPSSEDIVFGASVSWWDINWQRRIRIDINNYDQSAAFTNQPILITIDSSIINYSHFKTNGADVRFVASDDLTALDYEIERWDATNVDTSQIWVRVPSIAATSEKGYIYMYYNNPAATDAQNKTGVWNSYWAVWHLNENPSGAAPQYLDSTTNARNGSTSPTAPTRIIGVIGDSANLSNGSDYIQINTNLQPVIGNDSTFSCWMRTAQTGTANTWTSPGITGIEVGGSTDDIFFGIIPNGVGGIPNGSIAIGVGNTFTAHSNFVVNNNAWRHVTITRSTSGATAFYVNGQLTNSGAGAGGEIAAGRSFDRIGMPVAGGNFNGQLDEVRLFNSIQTADKIKADFKYMMNTHLNYSAMDMP